MNKMLVCAVVLGLALPVQAQMKPASAEEAVRKQCADFAAAWDKHDAKAMAALWAPDGDLINPWGRLAKGPAEVEKLFQDEHSTIMKGTTYKQKVGTVRLLGADVAIADWDPTIEGMKGPDGSALPPQAHHVTVVFHHKAGKWWVVAARPVILPPPPPGPPPAK